MRCAPLVSRGVFRFMIVGRFQRRIQGFASGALSEADTGVASGALSEADTGVSSGALSHLFLFLLVGNYNF